MTGKSGDSAHWDCNINLKLTKRMPVIFHNLRGYDSYLIIKEISKLDVKVSAISRALEKHMAFTINRNLVFIDSMQFMNSSLDALVKNLSEMDFKYLSQKMSGQLLQLLKQKCVYPYKYINSFKTFLMINCLIDENFFSSLKGKCISDKHYLHPIDVWVMFKM